MSRFFFYILAPVFLIIALLGAFKFHEFRQQVMVAFHLVYYLVIFLSLRLIGRPGGGTAQPIPDVWADANALQWIKEIALKEYEYICDTMAMALADRHKILNYFFIVVGGVFAAVGAALTKEGIKDFVYKNEIIIAVCFVLNFVSWIFLISIYRLRQAWVESALAMNRIKLFFLVNGKISDSDSRSPFLWKSSGIPRAEKGGNVYHLSVLLIVFITSLTIAVASGLLLPEQTITSSYWIPGYFFLFHFALLASTYSLFLKPPHDHKNKKHSTESDEKSKRSTLQSSPPILKTAKKESIVQETSKRLGKK